MSTSTQTATQVKTKTVSATKFAIAIACLGLAALAAAAAGTTRSYKSCTSQQTMFPPLFGGKPVVVPVCVGNKVFINRGDGKATQGDVFADSSYFEVKGFNEKEIHLTYFNAHEVMPGQKVKEFTLKTPVLGGPAYGLTMPLFPDVNNDTGDKENNFLDFMYQGVIKSAQNKENKGKLLLEIYGPATKSTCADSDVTESKTTISSGGGLYSYVARHINADVKGKIVGFGSGLIEEKEDECISVLDTKAYAQGEGKKMVTKLLEYYCDEGYGNINSIYEVCKFGCEDGRCITAAELKEKTEVTKDVVKLNQEPTWFKNKFGKKAKWIACVDTDEISEEESEYPDRRYWNPDVKGAGTGWSPFGAYMVNAASDYCYDSEILMEFFCDEKTSMLSWGTHYCEEGCYDGVCAKIK